jgi:Na+-driven multidrug efflux pump
MVFTFTYNYLASTLRAVGETKTALYFLLISLGYNLACAWLLVAVFELGITGTAIATATAQCLSSALCFLYIRKKLPYITIHRADMKMDRELAGKTVSFAAVAALQQSSLYLGKLMIQGAVNALGTAPITAFTAVTRVENFIQAFGISGCEAAAIFVMIFFGIALINFEALDGIKPWPNLCGNFFHAFTFCPLFGDFRTFRHFFAFNI